MPVYTCELCQKEFKQKGDLTKHQAKKTPCITMEQIQGMTKAKEETNGIKDVMKGIFRQCLDILRSEGLTGDKALRNLSYILILKLIEPQFRTTIDIQNYPYDYSVEDDIVEPHKARLMELVYFSGLVQEKQDNLATNLKFLWDDVLSQHPSTKNIFLKDKTFDMKRGATFKRLIDAVNSIPETTADVLGDAYEDVIKDLMKGKVLGQFFTNTKIKKVMIKLVNPQLHADGTIDTCGDPTMGTGGFLISYMQEILSQSKSKQIEPNWDFIKAGGLYGKELDPDTYQLAVSNMLISSGHLFEHLDQGDSLHEPIDRKFDVILSNPPFGVKGIKYDEFKNSPLKDAYVPIKTDNTVSLFLQAIVYMLKVGGRCAVVLPDGQDLFSKSKGYAIIREYLMKTCDLKEILYLPSGIFSYTPIKTCIFFFVKKCEGSEVLKVVTKTTSKKVTKDYTFDKKHHTKSVEFYDYNPYEEVKTLLVEVPIEKLVENAYSLNYAEYLEEEVEEYDEDVEAKTIGELFTFNTGSLQAMKCDESKEYPVISSSDIHTHSSFELEGENIFILKIFDGSAGKTYSTKIKYFNGKCNFTSLVYQMSPINRDVLNMKYIYYYLSSNTDYISEKFQKGSCNKSLDLELFLKYKIPIPSLERQQEIVDDLDFITETNKVSISKIADLKRLTEVCLRQQKRFGENDVKTLGEIFKFENGLNKASECDHNGDYMFITNADNKTHSTYSIEGENLFICRINASKVVFKTKIKYYNGKCSYSSLMSRLIPIVGNISLKYYYYYFKSIITEIEFFNKGVANKTLDVELLSSNLKIPIPSLERQQEIVDYCDKNQELIQQLEKEIERNQEMAKQFMSSLSKH